MQDEIKLPYRDLAWMLEYTEEYASDPTCYGTDADMDGFFENVQFLVERAVTEQSEDVKCGHNAPFSSPCAWVAGHFGNHGDGKGHYWLNENAPPDDPEPTIQAKSDTKGKFVAVEELKRARALIGYLTKQNEVPIIASAIDCGIEALEGKALCSACDTFTEVPE